MFYYHILWLVGASMPCELHDGMWGIFLSREFKLVLDEELANNN